MSLPAPGVALEVSGAVALPPALLESVPLLSVLLLALPALPASPEGVVPGAGVDPAELLDDGVDVVPADSPSAS